MTILCNTLRRTILGLCLGFLAGTAPAATFVVTNTNDSGTGSLRAAINDANSSAGFDNIEFNLSGSGPWTIGPMSPFPTITEAVAIDATTVSGYSGKPRVTLDGFANGFVLSCCAGLTIQASNSTVTGLAIVRFPSHGILIDGGAENFVNDCYIGLSPNADPKPNGGAGIRIVNGNANFIGSVGRNVIARNEGNGIEIEGGFGTNPPKGGNWIENNYLGIKPNGTAFSGSSAGSGVVIRASAENVVGTEGNGNVIAGYAKDATFSNATAGVHIFGDGAEDNAIVGNHIGVDPSGTQAIPNGVGVRIGLGNLHVQSGNIIGIDGTSAAARNVISGNKLAGVQLRGLVGANAIKGNYIGLDANGTSAVPNGYGIVFDEVGNPPLAWPSDTQVGGPFPEDQNVISGNRNAGVLIELADNASIVGNRIGTDESATTAVPNGQDGIRMFGGSDVFIGQPGPGLGNIISGNAANGIVIDTALRTRVFNNAIGTDSTFSGALGNGGHGIHITDASGGTSKDTTIGGSLSGEPNIIAHNGGDGIVIAGSNMTKGHTVDFNSIHDNGGIGIDLVGGSENGRGRTRNDGDDSDDGPNRLQNWPRIDNATYNAANSEWTIDYRVNSGTLASGSGAAAFPVDVNFYLSDGTGEEGENLIGSDTFTAADATAIGFKQITLGSAPGPGRGQGVTATATDDDGNTSEFTWEIIFRGAFELDPVGDVDRPGDPLEIPAEPGVEISGTTNLPAGTELTVEIASRPGQELVIFRTYEVTVDSSPGGLGRIWNLTDDFDQLDAGNELTIMIRKKGGKGMITPDGEPVEAVIIDA